MPRRGQLLRFHTRRPVIFSDDDERVMAFCFKRTSNISGGDDRVERPGGRITRRREYPSRESQGREPANSPVVNFLSGLLMSSKYVCPIAALDYFGTRSSEEELNPTPVPSTRTSSRYSSRTSAAAYDDRLPTPGIFVSFPRPTHYFFLKSILFRETHLVMKSVDR